MAHVGAGQWMVVDSLGPRQKVTTRTFLTDRGIPFDAVRVLVATHSHRDHVDGINELAGLCPEAVVLLPAPLRKFESMASTIVATDPRGLHPFVRLFTLVRDHPDRIRWVGRGDDLAGFVPEAPVTIGCVAPAPEDYADAARSLARMLEHPPVEIRRVQAGANNTSIVVVVAAGPWRVLLGADLERSRWSAAADELDRYLVGTRVQVVKVPHHGSSNAFSADLWDRTTGEATGMLAPFQRTPKQRDLGPLIAAVGRGFASAPPSWSKAKRYKDGQPLVGPSPDPWVTVRLGPDDTEPEIYLGESAVSWDAIA